MKKLFPLFLGVFVFYGCKQSAIQKSFSSADSLVIHFKDEQAGTVTKTVQTADATAIKKVIGFIDAAHSEEYKCGYDGKMFFYKKGQQVQEVDFKMKDPGCRHFSFLFEGKITNTTMSKEAVDFFDALERGMPYY